MSKKVRPGLGYWAGNAVGGPPAILAGQGDAIANRRRQVSEVGAACDRWLAAELGGFLSAMAW